MVLFIIFIIGVIKLSMQVEYYLINFVWLNRQLIFLSFFEEIINCFLFPIFFILVVTICNSKITEDKKLASFYS